MNRYEQVVTSLAQLAEQLAEEETLQQQQVALLRTERRHTQRAVLSLASGSPGLMLLQSAAEKELEVLDNQMGDATHSLSDLKERRKRVSKALRIMEQVTKGSSAPTAERVRPMVWELLSQNGSLSYEEIYDLVRHKLAGEGIAAQGLGLRVREALVNEQVESLPDGNYKLIAKPIQLETH